MTSMENNEGRPLAAARGTVHGVRMYDAHEVGDKRYPARCVLTIRPEDDQLDLIDLDVAPEKAKAFRIGQRVSLSVILLAEPA